MFRHFLAPPTAATILLIIANIGIFAVCAIVAMSATPPTDLLVQAGGLTPSVLQTHAYWRLLSYGFLHADPAHLLMNMFGLLILAPHLERQIGATYFVLLYVVSLVGAGLVSLFLHHENFVSVGASGALYGLLAALFALWILGKTYLTASFFFINFALNFAFSARSSNIDWAAHFGGFATGLALCAILDFIERNNVVWLRCKFPEFAKVYVLLLCCEAAFSYYLSPPRILDMDVRLLAIFAFVAVLCVVKIVDLILSLRRGLAVFTLFFVAANAAFFFQAAEFLQPLFAPFCRRTWPEAAAQVKVFICANMASLPLALAGLAGLIVLISLWSQFLRGLKDKGFVAATLTAERRRCNGL